MGINWSIFLYENSFRANQRSTLTCKSFVQLSGSSSRRMFCGIGFHTMQVVCTDSLCVVCIGLLSTEFSTVTTAWVCLCFGNLCVCWVLLRVWLTLTYYLNFYPKSSTFRKKLTPKSIRSFKWTADFILHIFKATTALYCLPQCTSCCRKGSSL